MTLNSAYDSLLVTPPWRALQLPEACAFRPAGCQLSAFTACADVQGHTSCTHALLLTLTSNWVHVQMLPLMSCVSPHHIPDLAAAATNVSRT